MVLTPSELDFFEREGYFLVRGLFKDAELEPLIEEISKEIDRLAEELVSTGELSSAYRELPFEQRLASIHRETKKVFSAIKAGNLCGSGVFSILTNPRLLDVAEQLCGPELIASSVYRLRPKLPGDLSGCIPWHQDSGYFEPYCDQSLIITCWIPLVHATPERGCLWLLPRAHKNGVYKHTPHPGKVFLEIRPDDLPSSYPVCVPARKGDVLIMTNMTPHSSPENNSEIIRWSIDVRYQSAALPTNAVAPGSGKPLNEQTSADLPSACYPPESDFLVRSRKRPDDVCRAHDLFRQLRLSHQPSPMTDRWNLSALGEGAWRGYSETYKVKSSK
jgi:phytanoyl-CoA hydroxylase